MNAVDRRRLEKAIEWEKMRSDALVRAELQQKNDLAKLAQLQNSYNQYVPNIGTSMSISTSGAFNAATTSASIAHNHACHTACGCSEESAPSIIYKTWEKPATQPTEKPRPKLTWETSPLFGRPAFGMFYNWTTFSFKPLHKWFIRWAWNTHKGLA